MNDSGSFVGMCGASMIAVEIYEVYHQIRRDKYQIDQIDRQHVAEIARDELRGDARNVAGDDEQYERKAHCLRAVCPYIFDNRHRPGQPKADQHHRFKDPDHSEIPPCFRCGNSIS